MHKHGICNHLVQNKCSAEQDPSSSALVSGVEREGLPLSWAGENKAPLAPQPGQQALCMGESSSKGAPVVPWGRVIAAVWQERCAGQEKGWCAPAPVQSNPDWLVADFPVLCRCEVLTLQLCPSTATWPHVGLKSERTGASCKDFCHLWE